jgi:hypothetical protein
MLTYILVAILVCVLLSASGILYMRFRPTLIINNAKKLMEDGVFYGYTKCNFKGDKFEGDIKNGNFTLVTDDYTPIKSIIVPPGTKITTYRNIDGTGPQYNYKGPTIIPCGLEIKNIVGKKD